MILLSKLNKNIVNINSLMKIHKISRKVVDVKLQKIKEMKFIII